MPTKPAAGTDILLTTTETVEGRPVAQYLGIVSGVAVLGFGMFKEFFSGFTDVFGGRSKSYQKEYSKAQEDALADLRGKAAELGGNAVIALHFDHESISAKEKSFTMVVATGTAVKLAD